MPASASQLQLLMLLRIAKIDLPCFPSFNFQFTRSHEHCSPIWPVRVHLTSLRCGLSSTYHLTPLAQIYAEEYDIKPTRRYHSALLVQDSLDTEAFSMLLSTISSILTCPRVLADPLPPVKNYPLESSTSLGNSFWKRLSCPNQRKFLYKNWILKQKMQKIILVLHFRLVYNCTYPFLYQKRCTNAKINS